MISKFALHSGRIGQRLFFFLFVVAPYAALPAFWRSWMYWLSPFHYLLEGFLTAVTHDVPAICDTNELARFSPPPDQTCASYADQFIAQAGGMSRPARMAYVSSVSMQMGINSRHLLTSSIRKFGAIMALCWDIVSSISQLSFCARGFVLEERGRSEGV
jgi:ABC-type multidrug transport system permease subunit